MNVVEVFSATALTRAITGLEPEGVPEDLLPFCVVSVEGVFVWVVGF